MPRVGVRELKNETSEVIRCVREERAEYVVTLHGRPNARRPSEHYADTITPRRR
jgi:antitoxin (DNA-binding transcriptional repressor) of toxin-antitoxin stability system